MLTIEQVVALLVAKFPGVRKDALQNMAGVIVLQAEDEASAQGIIDHMTADNVQKFVQNYRSNIDREIQQSNQTFEQNLRQKYNFVDKQQQQQKPLNQQQNGPLDLDQMKALFAEALAPLTQRMDAYEQQRVGANRRETYVGKLKEAKLSEVMIDMMSAQFDRMNFKDDAEFNAFLESSQPTIDKLAQQQADTILRQDRTPGFSTVNNDGVSKAVTDFLGRGESNPLGGKKI